MARKGVISIDIGCNKTKVAVGSFEDNKIFIEKLFMMDTPKGSYSDGQLLSHAQNENAIRKALSNALQESKIRYKEAVITMQSTMIIRRELEVPIVKPKELESLISYEIEQYLPIDLNEYIIEYKVLEEKLDNKVRILIAAMPKAIAKEHYSFLEAMNLEPRALDINSNAISKLFGFKQQINNAWYEMDNTVALIDLGYSNINVTIVSKGFYQFSRIIPTGSQELDAAVADVYEIPDHQIDGKKIHELDLRTLMSSSSYQSKEAVLTGIIDRWIEDIQRVFQYYKTRNQKNNIDKVYLYGGTADLAGIEEYFGHATGVAAERIKSLDSIFLDKALSGEGIGHYLNCIGAIIRK